MGHPEWALKFKTKNTELRLIRGRYYLYNIKSEWDPEKKRAKKITLGAVGTITEERGLVPAGTSKKGRHSKGSSSFKKDSKEETGFLDTFDVITDPRSQRNQLYRVSELLLLTLCAVLCGADGWQDIEDYGKAKLAFLRNYFDYEHGIPSDDTLRRFYRSLNPTEFEKLFREWVQGLAKATSTKLVSIESSKKEDSVIAYSAESGHSFRPQSGH